MEAGAQMQQGNNGRECPRDWCWPPNEVLLPEKHPTPPGAKSSTWPGKQYTMELKKFSKYLLKRARGLFTNKIYFATFACFHSKVITVPMSTWIFVCETNTDFNFGWNYIWQRVAGFGNILPQILEFQSSNGVTKCQDIAVWNYGVVLHFDINITEGGLLNKWCSHIQKEGQFCGFTWLIDFSRQKISILPDHL